MHRLFILAFCVSLFPICSAEAQAIPQGQQSDAYRQDLDFLVAQLPRLHKNLFAKLSEEEFSSRVKSLRSRLKEMDSVTFQLELSRLLASIGDGHTRLGINHSEMHYLPFNAYWFDDQVTVLAAGNGYEEMLGAKVTDINDLQIEQVLTRLRPYYSADNDYGFKHQIDQSLNHADLLAHVCGVAIGEPQSLTLEKQGRQFRIQLPAIPHAETPKIQWNHAVDQFPLCQQQPQLDHWNAWLGDSKTLYFKYNRCRDPEGFTRLVQGTSAFAQLNKPKRFVVDLRHNSGGNSAITSPLIDFLKNSDHIRQPGHLFVIVGRGTFSSGLFAAIDLKKIGAIVVGEPTGGKPNHFGEVKRLGLPQSGLPVYYSTRFWKLLDDEDSEALMPDVQVRFTSAEALSGKDPAMNAILRYREN